METPSLCHRESSGRYNQAEAKEDCGKDDALDGRQHPGLHLILPKAFRDPVNEELDLGVDLGAYLGQDHAAQGDPNQSVENGEGLTPASRWRDVSITCRQRMKKNTFNTLIH